MLRYAKVNVKVVNIRYRAPATYQSRPPSPPSPAAITGALAKAASMNFGEGAWIQVMEGIIHSTYRIVKPLTTVTYLMRRNLPPEQRVKNKGVASADPSRPNYKKPDNVFTIGELISGELELLVIFNNSLVPTEVIKTSLLSINVLGDNDSLVTPLPTTYRGGPVKYVNESEVSTPYVFSLDKALPKEGSWIVINLPTRLKPSKGGIKSVNRVIREYGEVVIPTEKRGAVLKPSEVKAVVRGRAYYIDKYVVIT